MKRNLAIGFSLANIWLLRIWTELLALDPWNSYFQKSSNRDFIAFLLNLILLGLLFTAAAFYIQRTQNKWVRVVGHIAFFGVVLLALNTIRTQLPGLEIGRLIAWARSSRITQSLSALIALAGLWSLVRAYRYVFKALLLLLFLLWPFTGYNIAHSVWAMARYQPSQTFADKPLAKPLPGTTPLDPSAKRVVILLFDGLDQRLAFSEPHSKLQLAHFEELLNQSLRCTQAYPPSELTARSLPALMTGKRVVWATPVSSNELMLTVHNEEDKLPWSQMPTIFSGARALGYNTAVSGSYHPYCRIMPEDLTQCMWQPVVTLSRAQSSFFSVMRDQLLSLSPLHLRLPAVQSYQNTYAAAQRMLADPTLGLIFIHWPVPHAPWIYDAQAQRLTLHNRKMLDGYLDNVTLADRTLGEMVQRMKQEDLWQHTLLIVTADHAWRSALYFDQKQDLRVPFIVHLPNQEHALSYDQPFGTWMLHDLVLAYLQGAITSPEALVRWMDTKAPAFKPTETTP